MLRYILSVFSGFIGIGDTMATTVGRCFDRSAAMRLIPDTQINAPEDSSSHLLGTGRFDVASELITHGRQQFVLVIRLSA
jgi:hypothetical protein